jgi:hypothetical protein
MIQNLRDYDFEPIFTVPTLIRNEREGAPYARTWVKGYPSLKIREEIDKRTSELNKLKELLLQIDQHDVIQAELDKINSSQGINDIIKQDESEILEFKSSVWAQYNNNSGELIHTNRSQRVWRLKILLLRQLLHFLTLRVGNSLLEYKIDQKGR